MNIKTLLKHKKIILGIGLLVVVGGYFAYRAMTNNQGILKYTTAAVEKGTLIVSVSGSGQVVVLNQTDIKPTVSGKLTNLSIVKDQYVAKGQLIASLDSSDAEETIYDAQLALDDAQYNLTESEKDYQNVKIDAEKTLLQSYKDGYDTVSTVFFKLSNYMDDLKDVLGTDTSSQEYVAGYELLLGRNSPYIEKTVEDYETANNLFKDNFTFFRTISREDDGDTIYQLTSNVLETAQAISNALDSARHMYDAVSLCSYSHLKSTASQIDTMRPKIESDVSSVYSSVKSLQGIKDTIDNTNEATPGKIETAQRAVDTAQNAVAKKEKALAMAQEELVKYAVYAPFSGLVVSLGDIEKGDTVSSNTTLATIITKQKIAELTLNEIDAANIKVNQKVTLTFDALPDVSIAGKVAEVDIMGQASQGVVSYGVKIAFDTDIEEVKPGMSVTVDIITQAKQDVLVLPSSAIKFQGNAYYVELVEADEEFGQQLLANVSETILPTSPKLQTVEIGLSNDLSTEVISGLKEGDIVITSAISSTAAQITQTKTTQTQGFQIPGMTSGGGAQMRMR